MSLLDVGLLKSISFALVFHEQEQGDDNGYHPKAGKDGHGLCVVNGPVGSGICLVHLANPHRYECQTNILNIEDDGISFQSRRKGTCHRGNNVKVSLRERYFNVVLVQCIVDHFFHLAVKP